jgi:hypothetical protein
VSHAAAELLSSIAQTGNHAGAPYAVVDKRQVRCQSAARLVCAPAHRERAMKAMSADGPLAELGRTVAMRQL